MDSQPRQSATILANSASRPVAPKVSARTDGSAKKSASLTNNLGGEVDSHSPQIGRQKWGEEAVLRGSFHDCEDGSPNHGQGPLR